MAYLTGIYLRNFQSIAGPVFLKLDKLCLLYGPNSAGKSAILDALDIIKKIVTLCDSGLVGDLLVKNQGKYRGFKLEVQQSPRGRKNAEIEGCHQLHRII